MPRKAYTHHFSVPLLHGFIRGACFGVASGPRAGLAPHSSSGGFRSSGPVRSSALAPAADDAANLVPGSLYRISRVAVHALLPHRPAICHLQCRPEKVPISIPFQVGKYLVSPLTRRAVCGRYAASVSIRSGRGSMTHDRVLRLLPLFNSSEEAARHASAEGLAWIGSNSVSARVDIGPVPTPVDCSAPMNPTAAARRPSPWPKKN